MAESPSEQAVRQQTKVSHAHGRLRTAWRHTPDQPLAGRVSRTGPTTGGDRSDPTVATVARRDHLRRKVVAEVARITLELAETLSDVDGIERPGSARYLTDRIHQRGTMVVHRIADLDNVLSLHRQWFNQLCAHVHDAPFDDGRLLMFQVHVHASAIDRTSRWAHGQLIQPPADPSVRVCARDDCQEVLGEWDDDVCRICKGRDERRPLIIAAQRARDALDPRPEPQLLPQEHDPEDGWPLCCSDHRPCGRRLPEYDKAEGRRNCSACRKHPRRAERKHAQRAEPVGTGGAWQWKEPT